MVKTYTLAPTTPVVAKYAPPPHITEVMTLERMTWNNTLAPFSTTPARYHMLEWLQVMLTTQRNHGSLGEAHAFTYLVNSMHGLTTIIDGAGNLHVDCRLLQDKTLSRTLFTAHTDTCHRNTGNDLNPVYVDTTGGKTMLRAAKGLCLGADDGAGVALMAGMISAGVPGYYIFFRGEEKGGVGSSWLAENMPTLLAEFDRAIAFDRAGYSDVITHQGCGRCCSDEFGNALAFALTTDDFSLAYAADNTGVYTDTAEFIGIIPECTNLSVAYKAQHGDREEQDLGFLCQLFDHLLTVQWESLPTKRDPKVREAKPTDWSWFSGTHTPPAWLEDWNKDRAASRMGDLMDDPDYDTLLDAIGKAADTGSHTELRNIIAELVHPDAPQIALNNMTLRLRPEDLDDAYNDMCCGADATTTADFLYTCCSTV